MILLPKDLIDADIINFVNDFVNLLAEEKYVEAFEVTYHDSKYKMSPELIKQLIERYGFIDGVVNESFRVTSLDKMKGQSPRVDIIWYASLENEKPREIGTIDYDLPINGEWSDLTAIFYIHELENGIALSIYDIHVL